MLDFVVIGAGLIGAATARHLVEAGATVGLVGPGEPSEPTTHRGVFASHYDRSRIVRRTTRDMIWATLTHRSLQAYPALEDATGTRFLFPRRGVHLVPAGQRSVFVDAADEIARAFGVPVRHLPDAAAVRAVVPALGIPGEIYGIVEEPPAGMIDPRGLLRAQLTLARRRGVVRLDEIARRIEPGEGILSVQTDSGQRIRAHQVIVAAGAYSGCSGLLPAPLALQRKSETVLLARIRDDQARRLATLPTLVYEGGTDTASTPYLVPPVRYPDGHYYIKMGANTRSDRELANPEQMNRWMRAGDSDQARDDMVALLRLLIPDVEILEARTKRCLITYTPEGWPMIDRVAPGLWVATGGNGLGAKASDALGALTAGLVAHGRWVEPAFGPERFGARFVAEPTRGPVERPAGPARPFGQVV